MGTSMDAIGANSIAAEQLITERRQQHRYVTGQKQQPRCDPSRGPVQPWEPNSCVLQVDALKYGVQRDVRVVAHGARQGRNGERQKSRCGRASEC